VKLQDTKMADQITRSEIVGHEFTGHKNARHEITGRENAGHEIAGQKDTKCSISLLFFKHATS